MQSSILKALSGLMLGLVVMLASGRPAAAAELGDREARLVGTWRVQVTLVDCQSGVPLSPPFSSLLTFALGGTMTEDTSNPAFGPGQRGAGQGTWTHQGDHTYGARDVAFILYTTPPDPQTHNPGFEAGEQTITQTITFPDGRDAWTSKATVEFADTTGTVYRQGCALASAQRF